MHNFNDLSGVTNSLKYWFDYSARQHSRDLVVNLYVSQSKAEVAYMLYPDSPVPSPALKRFGNLVFFDTLSTSEFSALNRILVKEVAGINMSQNTANLGKLLNNELINAALDNHKLRIGAVNQADRILTISLRKELTDDELRDVMLAHALSPGPAEQEIINDFSERGIDVDKADVEATVSQFKQTGRKIIEYLRSKAFNT